MIDVSVIIPVRNEAEHLPAVLDALRMQNFDADRFEVIVVDGRSTDGTAQLVAARSAHWPRLRLVDNPRRLSSSARNLGVAAARGRYIVVIDGHCAVPDRDYVRTVADEFETSGADCLGRPQPLTGGPLTPFQKAVAAARASKLGHNPDSAIYSDEAKFLKADNVAAAYRRELFERLGGFDEGFDACEDVEFNTRVTLAGGTCWFSPKLRVDYVPRSGVAGLWRQMGRYGRGRVRLARKHAGTQGPAALVPPLWMLWLLAWALAGLAYSPLIVVPAVSLLIYAFVTIAEGIRLGIKARAAGVAWRATLAFWVVHFGFGWGWWRETLGVRRAGFRLS